MKMIFVATTFALLAACAQMPRYGLYGGAPPAPTAVAWHQDGGRMCTANYAVCAPIPAATPSAPAAEWDAARQRAVSDLQPTFTVRPGLVTARTHGRPGGDVIFTEKATSVNSADSDERYATTGKRVERLTDDDLAVDAIAGAMLFRQTHGPNMVQLSPGGPMVPCVGQSPWVCTVSVEDLRDAGYLP